MGAYNVLSHFDKLYQRLGPLKRRRVVGGEDFQATPTILFLVSTLALIWMGLVLGYITLHEMAPGHRGNGALNQFYLGHLIFGCFLPVVFAFLVNSDIWWTRRILLLIVPAFIGFYADKILQQSWDAMIITSSFFSVIALGLALWIYLLLSPKVKSYYDYLRRNKE